MSGKKTLSHKEVHNATKILLNGDLARHALTEGEKAVERTWCHRRGCAALVMGLGDDEEKFRAAVKTITIEAEPVVEQSQSSERQQTAKEKLEQSLAMAHTGQGGHY